MLPTTSPASFMEVLSEDHHRVFHKDMGCMTGILQIFDRHPVLTGQRFSSKCNTNLNVQIMPTASGKPYHELRSNPAYDMAMEDSSQRMISVDMSLEQLKPAIMEDDNARRIQNWETTGNKWTSVEKTSQLSVENNSLSGNGDGDDRLNVDQEVVKHVQTTTTTTKSTKPRLSFYIQENVPPPAPPPLPATAAAPLSFAATGALPLPSPSLISAQSQNPKLSGPRQLGASLDEMLSSENKQSLKPEALELKDVLCESLLRQWSSVPQEKKNGIKDCDTQLLLAPGLLNQVSLGFSNSMKSSAVVSGSRSGDESELPLCERRRAAQQQLHELMANSDLPYLCSAETRIGSADVYIDEGCQMQFLLDSMEKDLTTLTNDNKLSNLWSCLEAKEVSRLTVELDDGPSISASSRNRHKMTLNAQASPPHTPLDNQHCLKKEEVRDDCWSPGFGFTDHVLQTSQQGRDGSHPFAFEGCKDLLPRVAAAPSSSPARSFIDVFGQQSGSFSVRGGDHQENNVVARLMGLDKLPNSELQKKMPPPKSLFCRTPPREAQLLNQPISQPGSPVLPLTRGSDESSQSCNRRGSSGSCCEAQMQEQRTRHTSGAQMQEQRDRQACEAQMQGRRDSHACEAHMMQERRDRLACEAQRMQEQKDRQACEAHHEVRLRSTSCQSPKFMEGMPPLVFKQQDACNNNNARKSGSVPQTGIQFSQENEAAVQRLDCIASHEPLYGDMAQRVRQLRLRNSVQERKTLKQILEAMQLKGLLHSPNHKQVQGLNSRSDLIMPSESYLQPHCWESNNQQPLISSKLTNTILHNRDHQAEHEHQEILGLLGSHEYYSVNSNTRRTHDEEMMTQGDEEEPQKIELVSMLETDSQAVPKSDHHASIVTMKPIKTKVASMLQAPKFTSPPTGTHCAESENGGNIVKNAQRKPIRSQARSNNESLKDGQDMRHQQAPVRWLAPPYSSSSSSATTATIKSVGREPSNNPTKPRSQYQCCAFGSGSTRMGEKKNRQGNLSPPLKEHEECKVGRLATSSSSKTPKLKESFKKGKTNSKDPNTLRSGKSASADAKLKPRIPDTTSRKSQRSSGASVELASNKSKPSKTPGNNTPQKFLKKQKAPSELGTNTVIGEEEDAEMDLKEQSWVQESGNATATVQVRIVEGEALDHSGDLCSLNPETVLGLSSSMKSSHESQELEMASAEVVKDKQATVDEEDELSSGLQKKPPNCLIKKFELSENLPTVGAMEQPSPVSVLNNTAFQDEELIPSPQSCTTPGINLEASLDDASERTNDKCTSLVDNVDVEEELAEAAAPTTVRKKLCFEIDSSQEQQQQPQQQQLLRAVKTSEEDEEDHIELLLFDSKNRNSSGSTTSSVTTGTSPKNKEDDQQFVGDLLMAVPDQLITKEVQILQEPSKQQQQQQHPIAVVPEMQTSSTISSGIINPAMLLRLEQWQRQKQEHNMSNQGCCKHEEEHSSKDKKRKKKKKTKEILDRRLLLDAFNEIITSRKLPLFLNQDVPWTTIFAQQHHQQQQQQLAASVHEPAMVRSFAKEVWDELQRIPCTQFDDDVHHTVQTVVRKDIGAKLQQSWSEFNVDVTEVGLEIERRIFKELVKEVIAELLWSQTPTTTSATSTTTSTMSTTPSTTTTTTKSSKTTSTTPTTTTLPKTPTTTTITIRVDVEQ